MNWPFSIGTQEKRPSPVFDRPIRRWREGTNFTGMRLECPEQQLGGNLKRLDSASHFFNSRATCPAEQIPKSCSFGQDHATRESSSSMQQYDVVIIGAGHNGLTCAAYLGMA